MFDYRLSSRRSWKHVLFPFATDLPPFFVNTKARQSRDHSKSSKTNYDWSDVLISQSGNVLNNPSMCNILHSFNHFWLLKFYIFMFFSVNIWFLPVKRLLLSQVRLLHSLPLLLGKVVEYVTIFCNKSLSFAAYFSAGSKILGKLN